MHIEISGGGGSGGITTYANAAALPSGTITDGAAAITLDTDSLYVYNLGTTTWKLIASPADVSSIGTFDSQTSSANGAVATGGALYMQSATATNPGLVNATTQSFAGNKTWSGNILAGTDATYNIGASAAGNKFNNGYFNTVVGAGYYPFAGGHTGIALINGSSPEMQMYAGGSSAFGVGNDGTTTWIRNTGTGDQLFKMTATAATFANAGVAYFSSANTGTTIGNTGSVLGILNLAGNTSGLISIQGQAASGTYNFNLPITAGGSGQALVSAAGGSSPMTWATLTTGTVTAVSVASSNGFAGSSSGGATPALTLSTSVTGILHGNGTAVAAAVVGDFPTLNQDTTGTATNATNVATTAVTSNLDFFPTFAPSSSSGNQALKTHTGFKYHPSSGNLSIGNANISGLTASQVVATDSGSNLISVATTGTGNAVLATAPTLSNPVVGTQTQLDGSTKAASTSYVDTAVSNAIAGVNPAIAVSAATTVAGDTSGFTYANGVSGIGATLTGPVNTVTTIDGFTFNTITTQSLLVKNDTQSPSGAFNGIYNLTALHTAGTGDIFTRRLDFDTPSDMNNTGAIPVVSGTVNGTTSWVQTAQVVTVGTTPLVFAQFSKNPAATQTANTFSAGPTSGSAATPTYRAVTSADVNGTTLSQSTDIHNVGFSTSVTSGALTITLTQKDGSTAPTTDNPAVVAFRSSTATTGGYAHSAYTATAALTLTASTTFGLASGNTGIIYIYAGSGSTVLASSRYIDELSKQQVVAESSAVTATNASPCVFTETANQRTVGDSVTLTGTPPTGFSTNTIYYLVTTPTGNTYTLSATSGGSPINSSSTGTSVVVHTAGNRTLVGTAASAAQQVRLIGRVKAVCTTGSWATPTEISPVSIPQAPRALTVTRFTSGSGTYIPPLGVTYLKVKMLGGGGGGSGSGTAGGTAATDGGNTTFGSNTAGGGSHGIWNGAGASGGSNTLNSGVATVNVAGAFGEAGVQLANTVVNFLLGGAGGSGGFGGGAGKNTYSSVGNAAIANSGSGGAGGSGNGNSANLVTGTGGGAGSFLEYVSDGTNQLQVTWAYSVGAGGNGGGAGTGGVAGGGGAAGFITVEEY